MRKSKASQYLQPLAQAPLQAYLGKGLHTLGLLTWILEQVGKVDFLWVSTYSTSEEFLSGLLNLKNEGMVGVSILVADIKAAKKTVQLDDLMRQCFNGVYLAENHSKVLLIKAGDCFVSVVTSQNQTYGGRAESTIVTTDQQVFNQLYNGFGQMTVSESVKIYGIHERTATTDTGDVGEAGYPYGDFRPFGAQE